MLKETCDKGDMYSCWFLGSQYIGKGFLEKVLRQEIELFLSNQVFKKIKVTKEEAKQVEFSYSFYTYALVGVGLDWIEKQMPESVEELVERIEKVMLGEIISLL